MPAYANVAYRYDSTFDGFLCCVFESFDKKELPSAILGEEDNQLLLCPVREVETDHDKARRVARSIPQKISKQAESWVRLGFLSCHPEKELLLLRYLRQGYHVGAALDQRLADPTVNTVMKMVKFVTNEGHLMKEFLRFSEHGGILVSVIHPKNFILPLLQPHFCTRFPNESFLIYDASHKTVLVYRPRRWAFFPVDDFILPENDTNEQTYQDLWKKYYDTIAVEGRYNPKCRMSHMPKRYWADMTEFQESSNQPRRQFDQVFSASQKEKSETLSASFPRHSLSAQTKQAKTSPEEH